MTILLKIIRLWNLESFVKTHTTKIVKEPNFFVFLRLLFTRSLVAKKCLIPIKNPSAS